MGSPQSDLLNMFKSNKKKVSAAEIYCMTMFLRVFWLCVCLCVQAGLFFDLMKADRREAGPIRNVDAAN